MDDGLGNRLSEAYENQVSARGPSSAVGKALTGAIPWSPPGDQRKQYVTVFSQIGRRVRILQGTPRQATVRPVATTWVAVLHELSAAEIADTRDEFHFFNFER